MRLKPVSNPPNPWANRHLEWDDAPPPPADLRVFEERSRSVISENTSPDVGFRFSLNPYRGCFHGCAYCYARPTHGYWDFGAGTDFERNLIVKINAPERLREKFMKPSWKGDVLVFSGNTDCYQPLEASYELTRRCLEVCAEFGNPVGIITKASMIRRDVDVLLALKERARVAAYFSIPFSDDEMARKVEPWAPSPTARFKAMRRLAEAGIPVGVSVSPIIPGLNDSQIADVLALARDNGATSAFRVLLRLPKEVGPVFTERIREAFPDRAAKVLNGVRAMRQGALYRSGFGERMRGEGPRWEAIRWLFDGTCRKLGLNRRTERDFEAERGTTFRRPGDQLDLDLMSSADP